MKKTINYITIIAAIILIVIIVFCLVTKNCHRDNEHNTIAPIPVNIDVNNLEDGIYPVAINRNTMIETENGYKIEFEIFNHDLYDMVDLQQMKIGDSIVVNGETFLVNEIGQEGDYLTVNGGIEQGGFHFWPLGGGVYQIMGFSDYTTYTSFGKTWFEIVGDIDFVDKGNVEETMDGVVVPMQETFDYLLYKCQIGSFDEHSVRIRIEDGKIVEFYREYRP